MLVCTLQSPGVASAHGCRLQRRCTGWTGRVVAVVLSALAAPLPLLLVAHPAGAEESIAPIDAAAAPSDAPAAAEVPAPGWVYTFEPYGFLPWVKATTTVRGFEADTDLAPGQVLNLLQSAVSARASAEKGRFGVLVDAAYTQVGAEQSTNTRSGRFTGSSTVTSINGVYDLALRYRLGDREAAVGQPGRWWLIPYVGARLIEARLGVEAQVRGNGTLGLQWQKEGTLQRTWTQLLLGTQASVFLSPALRLFARGDIGGFGWAGARDLSGNAQIGVGLAVGNNTDLNLSWRYQGIAYSNGASRSTGYSSDQSGVELGLKFFF